MVKNLLSWFDADDNALVIESTRGAYGLDLECMTCHGSLSIVVPDPLFPMELAAIISSEAIMSHVLTHLQPVRFSHQPVKQ